MCHFSVNFVVIDIRSRILLQLTCEDFETKWYFFPEAGYIGQILSG